MCIFCIKRNQGLSQQDHVHIVACRCGCLAVRRCSPAAPDGGVGGWFRVPASSGGIASLCMSLQGGEYPMWPLTIAAHSVAAGGRYCCVCHARHCEVQCGDGVQVTSHNCGSKSDDGVPAITHTGKHSCGQLAAPGAGEGVIQTITDTYRMGQITRGTVGFELCRCPV